mgnify:CR=1 FL=1|tara:strand:- start:455 stop:826 length:372 start_codon:yes stop_codon:yes gene_type:complete
MLFKTSKIFLKKASIYKLIVTYILFLVILFLFSEFALSYDINTERNLAYKYCKSIESNMFKGLDNERILKYEYFFNSINKEEMSDETELSNFASEVEEICSYKFKNGEVEEFKQELKKYLSRK